MGDAEALTQVVLPVAYQFNPQLVLVTASLDVGCRVSPGCCGHMMALLSGLAEGRIVLALEGGFNLTTISYCMTLCAKALLGDLLPPLEPQLVPNKSAPLLAGALLQARLVSDDNAHRPVFPDCQSYDDIHVTENVTAGSPVLLRLDRDGEDKEFFLTVIAKDSGLQPSQTSCSFRVVVEDVNDNPPVFDLPRYEQTLATDHNPATPVLRVSASDRDTGENARINYHLEGHPNHLEFFYLEPLTGVLTLKRPLQPTMANTQIFHVRVRAVGGTPSLWSTAPVTIKVVSSGELPPTVVGHPWQPAILENTTENTEVVGSKGGVLTDAVTPKLIWRG
ncbi:protocadherin Fat 1-like [Eriocheir sinensis]|uniref:protocadherin Fat 1-like n=1 Tax=Eriocheir sinensis TaxID=95602 RepID=UPI0021C5B94A|nr:protocadherin Fat 1-like [Eriocheir sinensis]